MIILSIETSCDDTCVAIIKASGKKRFNFKILSNIISSQVKIHQKWGGVYPTLAKREHQKNLTPVLTQALGEAGMLKNAKCKMKNEKLQFKIQNLEKILIREKFLCKQLKNFLVKYQKPEIDLISVTIGPGLEPCLWVGVNFAKALSYFWKLPIVPINHIEAHILANWLSVPIIDDRQLWIQAQDIFPAICLVISGGHTQLIFMKNYGKYKILGETRDDAAGECFDKVAKILGLGYPGGPEIETWAKKCKDRIPVTLPRPMIYQKNYDFSFSGLKTAVLYNFRSQPPKTKKSKKYIRAICKETQQAIIDVLIHKTLKAAKEYRAKSIILGGGVTANKELRKQFKEQIKTKLPNIQYLTPNIQFCTDNAAMVGITAYFRWLERKIKSWKDIKVNANLRLA